MEKDREAAAKDRFMDRIKIWGCLSSLIVFLLYRSVSGLRIDFIDVGQGDGILLETKKQVVLVDGGSTQLKKLGEQRLEPLLKSRGIRKIDMAFVSHGDQDYISGLMWLLEEDTGIEIGRLFLPLPGKGEGYLRKAGVCSSQKRSENRLYLHRRFNTVGKAFPVLPVPIQRYFKQRQKRPFGGASG